MQDFRGLKVWQKAHELTLAVYDSTRAFPTEERYGLTSQMRRACSSIPTNIAEGCGRTGGNELRHFLDIAMGSASEVEYQLILARDLGLLPEQEHNELHNATCEIKRMLTAFIKKLRTENKKPNTKS